MTKGALRAGEQLGLANAKIAQVLHLDAQAISAMDAGVEHLRGDTPNGQRAITLIKIHQALATNVGLDAEAAKRWIASHNTALAGTPASLMQTEEGMKAVLAYLQSMEAPQGA
ncbi:MbcA/ParS/Xre antitoxin family protein [Acidovorax sp. 1608163]|uniref:MbcA/ParS/Xre antitoxin family protein n=1 Tax=Acidovorax sp. 1608163 TaxID=2478662 RepID=UPI0013CE8F2D|nr:MbcA/ParS/Xre antitoxin family protein [Acidovorax sp. 1608163]